ncbi:MAG: SMP-30/gluconolactonase/LRE family protein [Gordonia sp. (in: high G+C Gram-positive bacteria)]|uniref:SMP-30/gluconolactonase/LRE family protein n=1 Tax=Gordonia sp. (in: high G+C Gram-positive bacteria) TaxID=84139 RepID=UPI0039E29C2C
MAAPDLLPVRVIDVGGKGPEDVLVADDGTVYTGLEDGRLLSINPETGAVDQIGDTGGRPLGIEFLPDGRLLVCDAHKGLLAVDPRTGQVEPLVTEIGGRPMLFCNNAAVSSAGDIWFTDSSTLYPIEQWKNDLVEDTRTGRLFRRSADGEVTTVIERLGFANGVALAADESFVCVAETAARTVVRHWLTGPQAGTSDYLVTGLPGYPDNIARGSDGLIWVTIASPTEPVVEGLQRGPGFLAKAAMRMPEFLQPKPKQTVRVQAFDDDGRLRHDVRGDASAFHMVTGVREHDGQVWLGSLETDVVGVIALPR